MAFQEYSNAFRHEEYTVGLSGRPAGLGLYISVVVRISTILLYAHIIDIYYSETVYINVCSSLIS